MTRERYPWLDVVNQAVSPITALISAHWTEWSIGWLMRTGSCGEIAQLRQKAARDAATVGESALRPLHRKLERAVTSSSATSPSRRRQAAAAPTPRRPRRKITDPVVLERRREALAKARQVRAEKLAAAKQKG